jgi:hypothetical protein
MSMHGELAMRACAHEDALLLQTTGVAKAQLSPSTLVAVSEAATPLVCATGVPAMRVIGSVLRAALVCEPIAWNDAAANDVGDDDNGDMQSDGSSAAHRRARTPRSALHDSFIDALKDRQGPSW